MSRSSGVPRAGAIRTPTSAFITWRFSLTAERWSLSRVALADKAIFFDSAFATKEDAKKGREVRSIAGERATWRFVKGC